MNAYPNGYCLKEIDPMIRFQSLDGIVFFSLHANTLGKGINRSILLLSMGKMEGKIGLFSLG